MYSCFHLGFTTPSGGNYYILLLKMRKWSWLSSSPRSRPVSSAEFFLHVQMISNKKILLSQLKTLRWGIFFFLKKILTFLKDIFLYSSRIAAKSYALWMPLPAISGLWPELVLMGYVRRWINLTKESLKLLFKSIYLIYNRHIDPSEF